MQPVLLYKAQTWTVKQEHKRKLRVFEMEVLRRHRKRIVDITNITGWTVAITCYICHSAICRKTAPGPCGAETPEPISMKFEIYDYIRDPTSHDKFGGGSSTWVVCANRRFVTFWGFFLSCFAFFITL